MADRSREEKLAAAKKRLKKFQKNDRGKSKKSKNSEKTEEYPVESNGKLSPELIVDENHVEINSPETATIEPNSTEGQIEGAVPSRILSQNDVREPPLSLNSSFSEIDHSGIPQNGRPTASTERIMQLSRHLNGIINDDMNTDRSQSETTEATIRDLESRNVELASLLEKRNHSNEQLSVQITQLREYNQRLQVQITDERASLESSLQKDLSKARDQVSAHLQTVGILVAEKSELQSQLSHSQRLAQQRLQEIEDLSNRMRAVKGRVDELEASIASGRESSAAVDSQRRELKREVDRLQIELRETAVNRDELIQVRDELQQRFQSRSQECVQLEKNKEELKKQVELSQIYIEQLSSRRDSANEEAVALVRVLETEKAQLQNRVEELDAALNQLTDERDRLTSQYREYIQQLQSQAQKLGLQLKDISEERDNLRTQLSGLEQLEIESQKREARLREEMKAYQSQERPENSQMENDVDQSMLNELRQEKSVLEYTIAEIRNRESSLSVQLEEISTSNRRLNSLLEERELERLSLSERLDQAMEERVDKAKLLEEMQSDKTALSRALSQNKDMKLQLVELENRFVNMTNDKMDTTNQLQHEQHVSKELAARLQEQEEELNEVRKVLSSKEEELRGLKQSYYTVTQQMFDVEGKEERTRAMQAQTQLVEKLQKELTSAQETINGLTSQNSELRTLVYQAQDVMAKETVRKDTRASDSSQPPTPRPEDPRQEVSALQASVAQLQMERDQLLTQTQAAEAETSELRLEVENLRPAVHEGRIVTAERFAELQEAQEQLEEKFNRAMERQADLNEQNDYLEHLVMQLEGETATIGDYISIYQRQRQALLEREKMKSHDMQMIELDRQRLRNKLAHLQTLVLRLLQEKEGSAQLTEYLTSLMPNGTNEQTADDWPSMTTSSDDDDDSEGRMHLLDPERKSELSVHSPTLKRSNSATSSPQQIHKTIPSTDHTAQEIIHLISELGVTQDSSGLPTGMMTLNHDINYFRPCKCCTGKLQLV